MKEESDHLTKFVSAWKFKKKNLEGHFSHKFMVNTYIKTMAEVV